MGINTTSLVTSKLLKENGFRQDTELSFVHYSNGQWYVEKLIVLKGLKNFKSIEWYSAPTLDELLSELPFNTRILKLNFSFEVECGNIIYHKKIINENLPDALAQMWLHLRREGIV